MSSPYENLPLSAYWRTGVAECSPEHMEAIYAKKWELTPDLKVATAGSCFAQHISRYLRKNGFSVMDVEPAPAGLPAEDHAKYGYGLYTARYANIYTVHQLLQLAREVAGDAQLADTVWEKDGRYYDAFRPSVEPEGLATPEDVLAARAQHLARVREMLLTMDVFVFTLGLTEAWVHRGTGTVYPTAPETIAGTFDPGKYAFRNYRFDEIRRAFLEFLDIVRELRGGRELKVLLTVSPVPLTATASGKHILQATTYSKSVLRAVAGQLEHDHANIDYFPSYEVITNQAAHASFYDDNLRTVKAEGVQSVMRAFFAQHGRDGVGEAAAPAAPARAAPAAAKAVAAKTAALAEPDAEDDPLCEEALLEAFNHPAGHAARSGKKLLVFVGDSHLASAKGCLEQYFPEKLDTYDVRFVPTTWLSGIWQNFKANKHLTTLKLKDEYRGMVDDLPTPAEMRSGATLCLVGLRMLGCGIVRAHGELKAGSPGMEDGRDISPSLPMFEPELQEAWLREVAAGNGHGDARIDGYREFYATHFQRMRDIVESLRGSGIYSKVMWVACPNMVEDVARFRFGDEYVDSGSHRVHSRIAQGCFEDAVLGRGDGWLITHPESNLGASGFALNRFAATAAPYDVHANAEFYRDAMQALFEAV